MFVAGKHINVERDGKLVPLSPGDPCPEASKFPMDVLARCMRVGQILNVDGVVGKNDGPEMVRMKAQATAESEAKKIAAAQSPVMAVKPLSTHDVVAKPRTKTKSTSAVNRTKKAS